MSNVDERNLENWKKQQADRASRDPEVAEIQLPLFGGGGGGTLPPMEALDAKIAAAEARTDTKFAELRGDLAKFATKNTVWGAVGTALAIGLAVAAFAGDRFDSGMSVASTVQTITTEQRERDASQDQKLDEILKRLPPAR